MANNIGQSTPAKYKIKKLIGQGAYGKVFLVYDRADGNTKYAMKLVDKSRSESVITSARLECNILTKLQHPHIACVKDSFENDKYVGMLLEYCPYGDLYNLCHQKAKVRKFTEATASHITKQLLEALDYMHARGYVHGDLKPENILVKDIRTMDVCITDFGLSQHRKRMTWLKKRCGSPLFMAPEKFERHSSEASDVWAIGIIVFEMVFGSVPFEGKSCKEQREVMKKPFENVIQPGRGPWYPKDVLSPEAREFIFLCLQIDPGHRLTALEGLSHSWIESPSANHLTPEILHGFEQGAGLSRFKQYFSKLMVQVLRPDELRQISTVFREHQNEEGRITAETFQLIFVDHPEITPERIQEIFNSLDIHHRGTVSVEQVMAEVAYHHVSTQDDRILEFLYSNNLGEDDTINIDKLINIDHSNPTMQFESSFRQNSFKNVWKETFGSHADKVTRKELQRKLFDVKEEDEQDSDDMFA